MSDLWWDWVLSRSCRIWGCDEEVSLTHFSRGRVYEVRHGKNPEHRTEVTDLLLTEGFPIAGFVVEWLNKLHRYERNGPS